MSVDSKTTVPFHLLATTTSLPEYETPRRLNAGWPALLPHAALLLVILGLNLFVRCILDRSGHHLTSFMVTCWPDHYEELYTLAWWQYLLPVQLLHGSWCPFSLLFVHWLEVLTGSPALVYYMTNAVLVVTSYCLSWQVLRSWVFSITLTLCFALSTFNHHVYVVAGGVALPLVVSYLLFFLFCQYKLLQSECNYKRWVPLGVLSMVVFALSYESWLDCVACMWLAYPFLMLLAYRAGDFKRLKAGGILLVGVTVFVGIYLLIKVKLGFGQVKGSESDVIFNYGLRRGLVGLEDMIAHFFTLFFIAVTTYSPPFLFNGSISSWRYGTEHLISLQHGYHEQQTHLVGYSHLFLWRYYAGFAAALFLYWFWKSVRAAWQAPSTVNVGFFLFLLMTLAAGATHMMVKYRPMHSAPFLGYHSYFGIVGYSLLLAWAAWWVQTRFQRRWLAWTLIATLWINLGYCALSRPSLLSHMAVQCGFAPYPDAWQNLKNLFGS